MKPFEITNPINASETECGLTILAWLRRERDRINKDPERKARIEKGMRKGYRTWQLVEDKPPPLLKGSHTTRIDAQNKAFKEWGRETPLTKQVY